MAYSKTAWVDNTAPAITAANLNKIENGIFSSSQFFNPKDSAYGAVGDGVTDDTTAIQNCTNAAVAVNGTVVFPPGTYVVSTITPASNMHWWAASPQTVTIQHKTGSRLAIVYSASSATLMTNISFENIKFLGNGSDSHTTVNGTQVVANNGNLNVVNGAVLNPAQTSFLYSPSAFNDGTNNRGFNFTGISGNVIQGVTPGATFTAGVSIDQPAAKQALFLGGVDGFVLRGCWVENFLNCGIQLTGYNNALIENNRFYNNCPLYNVANHMSLQNSSLNGAMTDLIIRGNILDTGNTGGIIISDTDSVNANFQLRSIIANNIVKNMPQWSAMGVESGYVEQLTIIGNVIRACANGITCGESEGVYPLISNSNRVIISENLIDSGPTLTNATGIVCTGSDLSFNANSIRTSGSALILGSATGLTYNENISVVGNTICLRPNDLTTNPHGISLTSNSRNVAIVGNNFNRMCCRARGAQVGVTTLAVDNVADWPSTGTIRVNGSASTVTYTSITQATRAGGGATINGLSGAVTVSDTQLVHLNTVGNGINVTIADDILIEGNSISNVGQTGIFLTGGVNRCAIIANKFLNCSTDQNVASNVHKSYICLDNSGAANVDCQIIDNIMQDPNTIAGIGVFITAGQTNTQVRDNYFNNGSGSYAFAFNASTAANITMDRNNRWGSTHVPNGGVFSSTPGAVTTVNIPHGLLNTPTLFTADRGSVNSRGAPAYSVTADGTNVILTFASALTAATVYVWNWTAYV